MSLKRMQTITDVLMSSLLMMMMPMACWQSSVTLAHYVSFYGDGFVQVPVGRVATSHTTLELHFRTSRQDALLFLVAGDSDYCAVTLQSGAVVLSTDLGAAETTLTVSSSAADASFADLDWHYINATWSHGVVLLSVDRVYARSDDTPQPFTELNVAGDVYIGGTSTSFGAYLYTGDVPAFRGCMHHVVFDGIDLLDLAHEGGASSSNGVTWDGCSPEFDARSDEAISFINEAAYVVFDAPGLSPGARLSFDIRTRSVDALVVYDFGRYADSASFLLLEIVSGRFKLRLGGERPVAVTSLVMVNDGQWHRVELDFIPGSVGVVIDGQRVEEPIELREERPVIETASRLFVGGVSESTRRHVMSRQLEFIADTKALAVSLVGCVRHLVVGQTELGWRQAAASRHLLTGCVWTYPCQGEPCSHGTRCVEDGYDTYQCRCETEQCSTPSGLAVSVSVEGPVRVRELVVDEGGRRSLSTEHISVLIDYVKAAITDSRVVFTVRKLPIHGVLFVADSLSLQTNVVSFSMSDLRQNRVVYFHDCSETRADGVDIGLQFDVNALTDVSADFQRAYNFTLPISVLSVNDRPMLSLPPNDTLVVITNTQLRLTASLLSAIDADDLPENLQFIVDHGMNGSSYFVLTNARLNGKNLTRLTQADVNAGHVRLAHRGPARQHLTLRVTDGKEISDEHPLHIVAVSIGLRAARNTGLVVRVSGSAVVITGDNLTFSCGAVHQNIDVRYELVTTPRYGDVQRRQHGDEWMTVTTFTQRQIDDQRVRYQLHNTTLTPSSERIEFRVGALTVRSNQRHVLHINIVDSRVELVRSTGLNLRAGERQGVITASELRAVSSDESHSATDITYRIVSTPRRGHLLLTPTAGHRGTLLQPADVFTQADIDAGRVVYRLQLALMMHIRDDFEFQLVTPDAASDVALFEFQYEPPTGDLVLINNGLYDVLEGNHKLIGLENIYVETESRADYQYDVVRGPMHGELRLVDPSSGDVLQHNATTFSNDDIRLQRLYYVHDDSETDYDFFRFVVPVVGPTSDDNDDDDIGWFVSQFDISIVLRNDNAPKQVSRSALNVVENHGRVLTTEDLLYKDPDINFDSQRLVYTWTRIANGEIVSASDRTTAVHRFTQKNVSSGELYFKHRGAAHALSEFTVDDGLFQVNGVFDVRAVEAYFLLSNTSTALTTDSDTAVAVLTEDHVSIETNLELGNASEVQFTVVKEPVHGELQVVDDDGRTRSTCRRFTLSDVRQGLVVYRRNVSSQSSEEVQRDQFVVVVRLDALQTTGSVDVDLTSRQHVTTLPPSANLHVHGTMTASVDELGDVVLTTDQLNVTVTSLTVSTSDIRYDVTLATSHGVLLTTGGAPVRTFTQADVDAGRVRYRHRDVSGSGVGRDFFRFRVRHVGDDASVELIRDGLEFTISVVESVLSLGAGNLTVIEGQSVSVDSNTLKLDDRYRDSDDIVFTIVTQPSHGHLEAADRPGITLTQFTANQLAVGALSYVHSGDETGFDAFTVSARLKSRPDRRTAATTVHVDVIAVNDQPPTLVTNTRMTVWIGSTAPITCQHLLVKDDDTPAKSIVYTMLSRPTNGEVLLAGDAGLKPVSNFMQYDIDNRLLFFRHQGASRGSFQFEVSDGLSLTDPASFLIEAAALELRIEVLTTLNAFPGIVQPITRSHLRASTNDPDQKRPIVFTVRSGPRLGRVVVGEHGAQNESTTFTQAQVDAGLVGYELTTSSAETAWSQTDSFVFDVSTEFVSSPLRSRLFSVSVSYEHVNRDNVNWLMTLAGVNVEEGGNVVISKSALDVSGLERRLNAVAGGVDDASVRYTLTAAPHYGTLHVRGALNLSTGDQFTQRQIDADQLTYQHDGSESTSDQFTFLLDLSDLAGSSPRTTHLDQSPFGFNISVQPVDDQPFQLMTMSPQLDVVQGSSRIITPDILLTIDDDTPPDQIVYQVSMPPTNGHLCNADLQPGDDVTQFSQLDVNQLKISFVSDASLDSSAFYFHVSDGVHKPLYKVFNVYIIPVTIALEPYHMLFMIQGDNQVNLTNETFALETNGNRSTVYYELTQDPIYGELIFNNHPVTRFSQADVDSGRLFYSQFDLTSALDGFELDVSDAVGNVISGIVVEVVVEPLIKHPDVVNVDAADGPFHISLDMLDASLLAEKTNDDPVYDVIELPRLGTLSVSTDLSQRRRRRRRHDDSELRDDSERRRRNDNSEDDTGHDPVALKLEFSHDDVANDRVLYTPNQDAAPAGDNGPQEDGFRFMLLADNAQPAMGSLTFAVMLPPAIEAPLVEGDVDKYEYVYVDDVEHEEDNGSAYVTTALIVAGGVLTSICSIVSYRCYRLSRRRRRKRRQEALQDKPEPVERHAADLHPSEPLLTRSVWAEPMYVATSEGELRRIRAEHMMADGQARQQGLSDALQCAGVGSNADDQQQTSQCDTDNEQTLPRDTFYRPQSPQNAQSPHNRGDNLTPLFDRLGGTQPVSGTPADMADRQRGLSDLSRLTGRPARTRDSDPTTHQSDTQPTRPRLDMMPSWLSTPDHPARSILPPSYPPHDDRLGSESTRLTAAPTPAGYPNDRQSSAVDRGSTGRRQDPDQPSTTPEHSFFPFPRPPAGPRSLLTDRGAPVTDAQARDSCADGSHCNDVIARNRPETQTPGDDDGGYVTGSRPQRQPPVDSSQDAETQPGAQQVIYDWDKVDPQLLDLCRKTSPVLDKNQYWV